MKPAFYVYTAGLIGVAFLTLRIAVALPLLTAPSAEAPYLTWQALGTNMIAIAVTLGFYTRTVALLACTLAVWFALSARGILPSPLIGHVLDAAVLAMVGPGAFSIDACLFGRRTLHLRP